MTYHRPDSTSVFGPSAGSKKQAHMLQCARFEKHVSDDPEGNMSMYPREPGEWEMVAARIDQLEELMDPRNPMPSEPFQCECSGAFG